MSFKVDYTDKYLKYKKKYLSLKNMIGGSGAKRHYDSVHAYRPYGIEYAKRPDMVEKQTVMIEKQKKISELNSMLEEVQKNMRKFMTGAITKEEYNKLMAEESRLTKQILDIEQGKQKKEGFGDRIKRFLGLL